jgi:hypothetical protein
MKMAFLTTRAAARVSTLALALTSMVLGCGDDDGLTPVQPPDEPQQRDEDPTDDDPTDIVIDADDDRIKIEIRDLPDAARAFTAAVVKVDGSETFSTADFAKRDDGALATLKLPSGLDSQADLVEWNLRIEREGSSKQLLFLRSLLYFIDPFEVVLEGPANVTEGKRVAYRVITRHPLTLEPVADKDVELLVEQEDDSIETLSAKTDESGSAVLEVQVDEAGSYEVQATAEGERASSVVSDSVEVQATGSKLLLTTDKPIYQPGQTIHLRALALQRAHRRSRSDVRGGRRQGQQGLQANPRHRRIRYRERSVYHWQYRQRGQLHGSGHRR